MFTPLKIVAAGFAFGVGFGYYISVINNLDRNSQKNNLKGVITDLSLLVLGCSFASYQLIDE